MKLKVRKPNVTKKTRSKDKSSLIKRIGDKHILTCKECKLEELVVSTDIAAVTCSWCVARMIAPPEFTVKKNNGEKFPRGWHFKVRYVHTDGRVFSKGKETGEVIKDEPVPPTVPKKSKTKVTKKKVVAKRK